MTTLAAIDRVVHHSVILDMMEVESYRATEVHHQHLRLIHRFGEAVTDGLFPNTERTRIVREMRSVSSSFTKGVYEPRSKMIDRPSLPKPFEMDTLLHLIRHSLEEES